MSNADQWHDYGHAHTKEILIGLIVVLAVIAMCAGCGNDTSPKDRVDSLQMFTAKIENANKEQRRFMNMMVFKYGFYKGYHAQDATTQKALDNQFKADSLGMVNMYNSVYGK